MNDKPKTTHEATTQNENEMGFLYKKLRGIVPVFSLSYWLSVPEFYDEILRLKSTNTTIDALTVFKVMQEIYKEKLEDKDDGIDVDFMFSPARRALRGLSKELTGSGDNWDNW